VPPTKINRVQSSQSFSTFIKEVLGYRELLLTFVWRDYRVRYAQTFLGFAWGLIQPAMSIAILWLVFSRFLNLKMEGVNPLAFIASGVMCWSYFAFVVTQSGQAVIQSQQMVKKIYFPKVLLPVSKAILGFIDLSIALLLLIAILIFTGSAFRFEMIYVPLLLLLLIKVASGLGIWISALTIKYRDVQQLVPFLVQIGLYITPVAYPSSLAFEMLPDSLRFLYYLNPMVGIIESLRYLLFGVGGISTYSILSMAIGLLIAATGVLYFHRTEKRIADLV
jgi:lipopolysaccharide transport system permease protein